MNLSDLPVRLNGQNVRTDASWWNDIRLVLLGLFGSSGITANTQVDLSNNATETLSDAIFDSSEVIEAHIKYCAIRGTTRQSGVLEVLYTGGSWHISYDVPRNDAGVSFSIDSVTGQLLVITSDDVAGKMQYQVIKTTPLET